ncbi:glycosyltransferase family 4 protein [Candidatus Parcubacteria bacterium]|nr:glycosyltransferase family 4 protein [Candidatus Parcubacteria bacterium]
MHVLVITQKVDRNDSNLGFFHRWLEEFSRQADMVTVICLEEGQHEFSHRVRVLSLGKEHGQSRFKYLWRFYRYIWKERKMYDAVFVHMNPEYIVLGGLLWRMMGKKIVLWYTHKSVDLKLRIAEKLSNKIFSSSKESFRIASPKVSFLGHGITTHDFPFKAKTPHDVCTILHVGRISHIKNCEILIEAAHILTKSLNKKIKVIFIGEPIKTEDKIYKENLLKLIEKYNLNDIVHFAGSVPNRDIKNHYYKADVTVNLSPTGGMDKAVLESWATGTPVVLFNEAFNTFLGTYKKDVLCHYQDSADVAQKITHIALHPNSGMVHELSKKVAQEFSLEKLITTLCQALQ